MADDNSAPILKAIFTSNLVDESGQPNLMIDGHELVWKLTNSVPPGQGSLIINPFQTRGAGPDQFHFKLEFSPPVFTEAPVLKDWDVEADKDPFGAIKYLYIAYTKPALSIDPGKFQLFRLIYTHAIQENVNSAKVTVTITTGANVNLDSKPIKGQGYVFDLTLTQAKMPTLSASPIAVEFVGRRSVLNDGKSPNTFAFAITNMTEETLPLTPMTKAAVDTSPTTFVVWFEVAENTDQHPQLYALARKGQLTDAHAVLNPTPANPNWSVIKHAETDPPEWRITVTAPNMNLQPHVPVLFTFSGITTDLDSGCAPLYLRFENLSVFPTGVISAEVEKTPLRYGATAGTGSYLFAGKPQGDTPPVINHEGALNVRQFGTGPAAVFNGGRVGIETGTTAPDAKLHIHDDYQPADKGTLILGPGDLKQGISLRFGCQKDYSWIQGHDNLPLSINPLANNVGIGTTIPGSRLSVGGGLAVGKSYAQKPNVIADNNLAVEGKLGVGTTDPGSALSVAGGAAIGKGYSANTTHIADNYLAVEGRIGVVTTDPGSSLSVAGGVAIGKSYAQRATGTVGDNILAVEGSIGIGTFAPENQLHVESANGIKLSLAKNGGGKLTIGNSANDDSVYLVAVSKNDNSKNNKSAAQLYLGGYENEKLTLPKMVLNATELDIQAATTSLTGNLKLNGSGPKSNFLEFGADLGDKKEISAGKIGYQIWSDGLDIVGAGTKAGDRKVRFYDHIYVPGNIWQYLNYYQSWKAMWPSGSSTGTWYNDKGQKPDQQLPPTTSDLRLKCEVQILSSPLEKIRRLSGVSFRWNDDALQCFTQDIEHTICAGPNATETENREAQQRVRDMRCKQLTSTQVGVIAQEVEAVLPEAVTTGDDGYKSVNYNQLIALLIEAIKEQDKAVTAHAALAAQQQIEIEELKQSLRVATAAGAGKH